MKSRLCLPQIDGRLRGALTIPFAPGVGLDYKTSMTVLRRTRPHGFSLVELLVVLAIMLILAVMLDSFGSARHQRTQMELCSDNLQKIYLAMQIYANDYGKFPVDTNAATSEDPLNALVPRYSADTSIFICPGGRDSQIPSGASLREYKISYAYYMGRGTNAEPAVLMSDRQINTRPKAVGDQVFSLDGKPPGNNHSKYGGNVLFTDGSVQNTPPLAAFSLLFSNGIVLLNPKP
ncbi:MAG TPA: type II secretion system protein [Verrucomicrobiae bacterium]|nr:type II secretion system protein [Verrucomicrobiae bacterium]